jgi:hypothetical protein
MDLGDGGDLIELNGWTSPQMLRRYCGEQRLQRLPKFPEVAGITLGRVMIPRNRTNKILHKRPGGVMSRRLPGRRLTVGE